MRGKGTGRKHCLQAKWQEDTHPLNPTEPLHHNHPHLIRLHFFFFFGCIVPSQRCAQHLACCVRLPPSPPHTHLFFLYYLQLLFSIFLSTTPHVTPLRCGPNNVEIFQPLVKLGHRRYRKSSNSQPSPNISGALVPRFLKLLY